MASSKAYRPFPGYRPLLVAVFLLYVAAVLFCCLHTFSFDEMSTLRRFLGMPSDKLVHFIMFLPYPLLFCAAYRALSMSSTNFRIIFSALLTGVIFAALTEIGQGLLTETRTPDIYDFYADGIALGVSTLSAIFLLRLLPHDKRKKKR